MIRNHSNYTAYMLRIWQEERNGRPVWRASLETPGSGERRAFASLTELLAFLETDMESELEPAQTKLEGQIQPLPEELLKEAMACTP